MKKTCLLAAVIFVCLAQSQVFSQTEELPKFEVAAEFTTLERESFGRRSTEPGLGARFTYNINKTVALEAASYFFPKQCFNCRNNGRVLQAVGGVRVGKRFDNWGIFAKARPGVVSFSDGETNLILIGPFPTPIAVEFNRLTSFHPRRWLQVFPDCRSGR